MGACRSDLVLVKGLWDLAAVVHATLSEWRGTLWAAIETDTMEAEAKALVKSLRALPKQARTPTPTPTLTLTLTPTLSLTPT